MSVLVLIKMKINKSLDGDTLLDFSSIIFDIKPCTYMETYQATKQSDERREMFWRITNASVIRAFETI